MAEVVVPYRHKPTQRGDPCPWMAHHGKTDWPICYGSCQKRCANHQSDTYFERREARANGPRVFPKPTGGNRGKFGYCQWCGDPVVHHEGPKAGELNTRRGWHDGRGPEADCLWSFYVHTRSDDQQRFLLRRDGPGCAECGEIKGQWGDRGITDPVAIRENWPAWEKTYPSAKYVGEFVRVQWECPLEVDHEVPLWSVAHLPDEERQPYFGPLNIRLLCQVCHKAKTKIEAAERANLKADLPRCGNCVTWNGLPGDVTGGCSREGVRRAAALPCREWFTTAHLSGGLYGKAHRATVPPASRGESARKT